LEPNSIDFILTDPPYFIDGMGDDWDRNELEIKVAKAGVIGGRPIGMKFDINQGIEFERSSQFDLAKRYLELAYGYCDCLTLARNLKKCVCYQQLYK
jgi:site-specific DNA-methyltransferase (adenine-specific)